MRYLFDALLHARHHIWNLGPAYPHEPVEEHLMHSRNGHCGRCPADSTETDLDAQALPVLQADALRRPCPDNALHMSKAKDRISLRMQTSLINSDRSWLINLRQVKARKKQREPR